MFKKLCFVLINLILLANIVVSALTTTWGSNQVVFKFLIIIIGFTLLILSLITYKFMSISRLIYVLFVLYSLVILCYSILQRYDILTLFSSVTSLKEYILSTREKGVFTYILIQCAQVVFLPIPAAVICIVGSIIYGPLMGGIYCSIGVIVGSFISFYIGKTCGHRVVSWIVGENNCNKYSQILLRRGSFFLGIAFLLPMFPDDILCLIAGITGMSILSFAWVTILIRPIGVICMSYFGSGKLIPFTGWGIYVWLGILVLAVALVFLTYKYQEPMQEFILNKVFKKSRNKSKCKD